MSVVLKVEDVTVTYPDGDYTVTALDHANLTVEQGSFTGILGTSGSGKSTLLAVAGGLIVPDEGRVEVAGHCLNGADDATITRIRRDNIGLVFQTPGLISSLKVIDQLLLTDHVRGNKLRPDYARELLELVGLPDKADRPITALSGGQRQRVGIARALMGDPSVILADEPTSALDHNSAQTVMDLLARVVAEKNVACVMVTHDRGLTRYMDNVLELGSHATSASPSLG